MHCWHICEWQQCIVANALLTLFYSHPWSVRSRALMLSSCLSVCLTDFLTSCWHSEQFLFWYLCWKVFLSVCLYICLSVCWPVFLTSCDPVDILNNFCWISRQVIFWTIIPIASDKPKLKEDTEIITTPISTNMSSSMFWHYFWKIANYCCISRID